MKFPRVFMRRGWLLAGALLSVLLLAAACGSGDDEGRSLTFMAGFKPQANLPFVAAYVAQSKGYFQEQGLDVTILHSTGGHLQLLLSGDVDVTTADAGSVLKRRADPDIPIRAIALFGQRGQQAFIALESSGIESPKDWEGKRLGYKTTQPPEYLALLDAAAVDRSKIEEVRVGFDPRILIEGQVDILAVFKSNEPDTLRRLGFPTRLFDPADFGVPTLGLTYIVTADLLDSDPDLVKRFLKATMRGFAFALENEEETLDIVLEFAPQEDREHQRFMLRQEISDARGPVTDANGLGFMTDEQWQVFYDTLLKHEALARPFDPRSAYTTRFLQDIYDGGELQWP